MADEAGATNTAAQTDTTPATTSATTQAAATTDKTFRQDEVDRIVGERAKRAEEAAVKKLMDDLGVKTPDEAKAALGEYRKSKAAQQTDLERAQARLAELEDQSTQASTRYTDLLISTAIERAAGKMNFEHPELAYKLIEMAGISVDKDDRVIGVDEALKKLTKDYPSLIKMAESVNIDATRRSNGRGATTMSRADWNEFAARMGLNPMFPPPHITVTEAQ